MNIKTRREIVEWLRAQVTRRQTCHWHGERTALADLGIDSLAAVELVCELESWLGMGVPSSLMSTLIETDGLIDAIERLQDSAATACALPTASDSDYGDFVNPYIAGKLAQLRIDRTFVKAEGAVLVDAQGRHILDFMAQYGALPFGHHPREIWQAIDDLRADGEPVFAQPSLSRSAGLLARRLIELAPRGLRYVTFSNSGAEAVEVALKMARHVTGRPGFASTHRGFHGKTFGALSATGNPDYQAPFGLPLPDFTHIDYGDAAALEALLAGRPGHYAAFIVETIQGEGGVRVAPPGYLRAAKAACERHGTLLIVDEVQTGLGRTGEMFSCEGENVLPDIITLAKALGGGLVPIGATLCTEAAYSEKFALKHSSTFAGNALAARAGLATLALLTRDDRALLAHVEREGRYLRARLEALQRRHAWLVEEVRGRGFMLGVCFTSSRASWPENFLGIAAEEGELAQFVASHLLNVEGVRLAPTLNGGNVLRIQPPLNATHAQCVEVADALDRTVAAVAARHTGDFYRAILRGERVETTPALELQEPVARAEVETTPAANLANRFAFLLHPLDERGYADYDDSLSTLSPQELREFSCSMAGLLDPVVGSSIDIQSKTGATARGDFIMISYTADQLKRLPQSEALRVLNKGVSLACERGATIVGLGAYTSIVSGGGTHLAGAATALTSGNSYTVVSAIEALDGAVARRGVHWSATTAAVVGAAGAIGACMAVLLAERCARLVLVGNPAHAPGVGRARLVDVVRQLFAHVRSGDSARPGSLAQEINRVLCSDRAPSTDAALEAFVDELEVQGRVILTSSVHAVALAGVVVTATSFPGSLVAHDVLAQDAIVCDISRPRSVDESIVQRRPDVLLIDGGLVALPNRVRVGPYGIETGTSYACMAETMLLALEGDFRDASLGGALSIVEVRRQQALARKHGFSPAPLRPATQPASVAA